MAAEALITTATTQLVKSLVEKVVIPKINDFTTWCKGKYDELLIPTAEHFQKYLERAYTKYSILNALAIPNSQFLLKDIYVVQTLKKVRNSKEEEEDTAVIDKLPISLIKKYQRILIKDTAGMGKSTITKYMFINLIDNGLKDVGIPIYIELNKLNKERPILTEIHDELSSLSKEFDKDLMLKLIQRGGFIFFLDGYDEISLADKIKVKDDIQNFISKAGSDNYYILTSRPEETLPSFGDFQSFKIEALTKKEAYELLTKYDVSSNKKISQELIKELNTGNYKSINEYLENPLLVSLLYSAFNFKAEIPLKKHQFYRQVYDALYNAHKLAQGIKPHEKRSGLDIDDFNRVLRYVGYDCLIEKRVRFDKDTILKIITDARDFCGNLNFGESAFLDDLLTSVPLFTKDGTEYKWAHKSLLEYFAARFIADDTKEDQDEYLKDIYRSENIEDYINMLDIYYDIDFKGFAKNIILPFCEDYIEFYNKHYIRLDGIKDDLVKERIGILFRNRIRMLVVNENIDKNELVILLSDQLGLSQEEIVFRLNENIFLEFKHNISKTEYIVKRYEQSRYNEIFMLLMFQKNPFLLKSYDYNSLQMSESSGLDQEKAFHIDVRTGESDESVYQNINTSVNSIFEILVNKPTKKRWYPNYEAFVKERDKIETLLSQNKSVTKLLKKRRNE